MKQKNNNENISKDRKKYIRKIKIRKLEILFTQITIIIAFIAIWEILANKGKIDSFIMSQPSRILKTFLNLTSNNLLEHLKITIIETLLGFSIGVILGFIIAIILWWSPFISKVSEPFLVVLNSLPKIALGPVIIIWVGASTNSIIFMALLISLFITIINIYNGFNSTNENYIKLLKSLNASRMCIFLKVVMPSNIKNLISTMKINISMTLIGVIMGELLVSKRGLGYLIMYGSQVFNINLVITSVFILGIIAYLMYKLITIIENKYNKNNQ